MTGVIDFDEPETWPPFLRKLLIDSQKPLTQQQMQKCTDYLKNYKIICYHCTKLTSEEISDIRKNGLLLLDEDLATKKIQMLSGFSQEEKECLLTQNLTYERSFAQRNNMVHFVLGKNTLTTHRNGLSPFFQYWGGESMYKFFADASTLEGVNLEILKKLKATGIPYIIKFSLDWQQSNIESRIAKCFINQTGSSGYSKVNIPHTDILNIFKSDSNFFTATIGELP